MNDTEQIAYVFVGTEQIKLNQAKVEFQDIHEGAYGEDRVTFRYRGKVYESPVILKKH